MASIIFHGVAATAICRAISSSSKSTWVYAIGILISVLPDLDVIGFSYGIPYNHVLGHRGISHSIFFALVVSSIAAWLFKNQFLSHFLIFFFCAISHGCLDAMTTGGRGIAFLAPFENSRYFFPYRPILVSPIGIKNFFSDWGLRVLWSECKYIGLPSLIVFMAPNFKIIRFNKSRN